MKQFTAWLGFVYDVGRIIFFREWDEPNASQDEPTTGENSISPVVKIPPAAASMIAPAASSSARAEAAPLEGSIEARRLPIESR